jgi:hypothetical protein
VKAKRAVIALSASAFKGPLSAAWPSAALPHVCGAPFTDLKMAFLNQECVRNEQMQGLERKVWWLEPVNGRKENSHD